MVGRYGSSVGCACGGACGGAHRHSMVPVMNRRLHVCGGVQMHVEVSWVCLCAQAQGMHSIYIHTCEHIHGCVCGCAQWYACAHVCTHGCTCVEEEMAAGAYFRSWDFSAGPHCQGLPIFTLWPCDGRWQPGPWLPTAAGCAIHDFLGCPHTGPSSPSSPHARPI